MYINQHTIMFNLYKKYVEIKHILFTYLNLSHKTHKTSSKFKQ